MPTPPEIKAEILNDAASRGYAAFTAPATRQDNEILRLLNEEVFRGPVPIIDVSAYCTVNGITGAIQDAVDNPLGADEDSKRTCRILCRNVLTILLTDWRLNTADTDSDAFAAMTGGLIAFGLLTSGQRDAIKALGDARRSRADILWGRKVSLEEISEALSL